MMTTCTWKKKVCLKHTHCLDHTEMCGKSAVAVWEIRVLGTLYRYTLCHKHAEFIRPEGAELLPL